MPSQVWNLDSLRARGLTHVEHHDTIGSTNDAARGLAATLPPGAWGLILAERQTAGRGRGANRWWTGDGAVAMSLLVDTAAEGVDRIDAPLVSLATGVALIETISRRLAVERLGLHWPNDVFADGRKLAGILVERLVDGRQIVGVGVNVNNSLVNAPYEIRDVATSMIDLSRHEHDRTELVADFLDAFRCEIARLAADAASVARRADTLCLQRGRTLTIQSGHRRETGVCRRISDQGALVLATAEGEKEFVTGYLIHGDGG